MKIGLISDVHANLPALDAVLDDLKSVDKILHAGDIVGYNPFPREVIARFQREGIDSIAGNHDRGVVGGEECNFPDFAMDVIDWTSVEISNENQEYIDQLPNELQLQIDGINILIVHGSPYQTNEYIYPTDLELELVEELDEGVDVLMWGHTHYPVISKINDVFLLNPGSVGQPRDGDWRASYAIFDTKTNWVELRRQEYNIDMVINRATANSFPQQAIDLLD